MMNLYNKSKEKLRLADRQFSRFCRYQPHTLILILLSVVMLMQFLMLGYYRRSTTQEISKRVTDSLEVLEARQNARSSDIVLRIDSLNETVHRQGRFLIFGVDGVVNPRFVHFAEDELKSHCFDGVSYLDVYVVHALNYIRSYYGNVPIKITSTERLESCNKEAGGVANSWHKKAQAVDFKFLVNNSGLISQLKMSVINQDDLFEKLVGLGVRGFGFYRGHIHLDTRSYQFNSQWRHINYSYWSS